MCSASFVGLGRAQQKALGSPDLPIAVVPHPFGTRSREELREIAVKCADEIARLLCERPLERRSALESAAPAARAKLIEAPADLEELEPAVHQPPLGRRTARSCRRREEAVQRMLRHTRRAPHEVVATIAPGMGAATVEYIAINARDGGLLSGVSAGADRGR